MSKSQWWLLCKRGAAADCLPASGLTWPTWPPPAPSPQVSASGGCINLARLQLAAIGKHNHNRARAAIWIAFFSLSLSCKHTRALTPTPHFNNGTYYLNKPSCSRAERWKIPWSNARLHWLWSFWKCMHSQCTAVARRLPQILSFQWHKWGIESR
jgi:hypothetical protein